MSMKTFRKKKIYQKSFFENSFSCPLPPPFPPSPTPPPKTISSRERASHVSTHNIWPNIVVRYTSINDHTRVGTLLYSMITLYYKRAAAYTKPYTALYTAVTPAVAKRLVYYHCSMRGGLGGCKDNINLPSET